MFLSNTETQFQEYSQSGENGFKQPIMLSIFAAHNVISGKKINRNTKKIKIAEFSMQILLLGSKITKSTQKKL